MSCFRSHEVSRALWEAAAAPVDSDTSLAELCRQVEFRFSTFCGPPSLQCHLFT